MKVFRFVKRVVAGFAAAALAAGVLTAVAVPAAAVGGWGTSGPQCKALGNNQFKAVWPIDASADASANLTTVDFYHGPGLPFGPEDHFQYTLAPNESTTIEIDLSSYAPGTFYYYLSQGLDLTDVIIYTIPDCSYDPANIVGGFESPVCFNPGTLVSQLEVTSLNSPDVLIEELISVTLDGVPVLTDEPLVPGETLLLPGLVPADTPVGSHNISVLNRGVALAGMSFNFTISQSCAAAKITDFLVDVQPPYLGADGSTAYVNIEVTNIGAVPAVASIYVYEVLVASLPVPAFSVQTQAVSIPLCELYNVRVNMGFTLDSTRDDNTYEPFGCLLEPPVRTSGPTVSGTARVGYTLTCNDSYTGATSISRYWSRSGTKITGAIGKTYKLTAADYNKRMSCTSSASNADGSVAAATSPQTGLVALGVALKPVVKPSIAGTTSPGKILTARNGTWSPPATTYKYQWQRLVKGKWVNNTNATGKTYKVPKAYDNRYLRVVVTALKPGYNKGVYASVRVYI